MTKYKANSTHILIRYLIVIAVLLFSVSESLTQTWQPLTPAERTEAISRHLQHERDNPDNLIIHRGYVVNFREGSRVPNWSIHQLTFNQLDEDSTKASDTDPFDFDPAFDSSLQADEDDYKFTPFDKGHFVPDADFFWNKSLKDFTYFMTNMTPQTPDFNQGIWKKLEGRIRKFVRSQRVDVHVITGALYLSRHMTNRGISQRKIKVPSHHYKVVYGVINGEHHLYSFIIPHTFAYSHKDLTRYQFSLDTIERMANEDFFERLPDPIEDDIELNFRDASSWVD